MRRIGWLLLLTPLATLAQSTLTTDEVEAFVRSSIRLRHADQDVAAYLQAVRLRDRLDETLIGELKAIGAGPGTLDALRALRRASQTLPPAPESAPSRLVSAIPTPSEADCRRAVEEARRYAASYTKELPNFICTQITRRSIDATGVGIWKSLDVLTANLSYFGQKEQYKLVEINGKPADKAFDKVGGSTSKGEFGSMMRLAFDEDNMAEFRWERWATLRGRRTHVFSYHVGREHSKWRVVSKGFMDSKNAFFPAYHGLVYVDRDSGVVTRLTFEAEDLPPKSAITALSSMLDYSLVRVGEQEYVLPLRSEMQLKHGKTASRNEVEFRSYRKFSAESAITFDVPDVPPPGNPSGQPPKP
jgi:hypothetical protein